MLSALLLVSCSESQDIQLEPEVSVFFSNDREKEMHLTAKDKEYTDLNLWLSEHRSGWHPTSGPYPGGVYIKSGVHGIQVMERYVVLYSTSTPEPRSIYIQKIDRGELSGIRDVGR